MDKIFDGSRKIGAIMNMLPEAAGVFYKYNMNYEQYIDKPLHDFAEESDVGLEQVLKELNGIIDEYAVEGKKPHNYKEDSSKNIIKHILKRHNYTKKVLKEIDGLLLVAMEEQYENHGKEIIKVYRIFEKIKTEIEIHLIKEEVVLFKLMHEYDHTKEEEALKNIKKFEEEVEEEHKGVCGLFTKLREYTNYYKEPEDANMSYERAYFLLKQLERDLFEHISLENTILFKKYI